MHKTITLLGLLLLMTSCSTPQAGKFSYWSSSQFDYTEYSLVETWDLLIKGLEENEVLLLSTDTTKTIIKCEFQGSTITITLEPITNNTTKYTFHSNSYLIPQKTKVNNLIQLLKSSFEK